MILSQRPGCTTSVTPLSWWRPAFTRLTARVTSAAPKVRNRIIPGLGKHRLDRLTAEHLERFYSRLEAEG
jgi:hypothetical protein